MSKAVKNLVSFVALLLVIIVQHAVFLQENGSSTDQPAVSAQLFAAEKPLLTGIRLSTGALEFAGAQLFQSGFKDNLSRLAGRFHTDQTEDSGKIIPPSQLLVICRSLYGLSVRDIIFPYQYFW